ncbi:MAG TPA: phosphonate ABC transporter, permease protein PhnE [bacterium]|nr:phosphonate ABC transporter, permease protein PhnE [bacterium]
MSAAPTGRQRLRFLWDRLRGFVVDWALVAFGLLLIHFLLAYYFTVHVRYTWIVWLLVAALLAETLRAWGASPALRLFGKRLVDRDNQPPAHSRRLLRLVTWLPAAAVAGAGLWTAVLRADGLTWHDRLSGTRLVERPKDSVGPPWYRTGWGVVTILLFVLTYWVAALVTEVDLGKFLSRAATAKPIFQGLFTPEWSLLALAIKNIIITLFLALVATTLAVPAAFLLSFLGARNLMTGSRTGLAAYYAVRTVMNVTRSIEPLVWAIIFSVWVGIGPFAGTLALAIHSIAGLGKLYSEQLEAIDPGPLEAVRSTGARTLPLLRWGVVPQIVPPFLSFTIYRWDINVRMATIIGLVGGGGIGQMLMQYQQLVKWQAVGLCMWLIALVVWIMDILSAKIRERLV